jgi:hypothetical protein
LSASELAHPGHSRSTSSSFSGNEKTDLNFLAVSSSSCWLLSLRSMRLYCEFLPRPMLDSLPNDILGPPLGGSSSPDESPESDP